MVLSDELWQSAFGADASLVGKRVILNRTPFTVIGIAPQGFGGTEPIPSAFWVPITMQPAMEPDRDFLGDANVSWLSLLGRVRPGVSMSQVRADLSVIASRIDQQHPGPQNIFVDSNRDVSGPAGRTQFCNGSGCRHFVRLWFGAADRLRERGELDAGPGHCASKRNRRKTLRGSEPLEIDSAIADRKRDAGADGRRPWIGSRLLVLRRNFAFRDFAFAAWLSAAGLQSDS